MALRLKLTSRHRQVLGERATKEFGRKGGTIGRSLESDWVLPDALRYVSSRHASIDYRSGSYYIVDTSTNGVYVNDADAPVGRGNPQRLFAGDRIRLGEYEMVVEIEDEPSTTEHLMDSSHVDPVALRQRVDAPDATGADLVQAHEITAVGIEIRISDEPASEAIERAGKRGADLRLEDDPPKHVERRAGAPARDRHAHRHTAPPTATVGATPDAASPPSRSRSQKPASKHVVGNPAAGGSLLASTGSNERVPPVAAQPASQPRAGGQSSPLGAFFRGAGIEPPRLDSGQTDAVLHLLGQLLREMLVGLGENLHLRAEQKNAIRVPSTTTEPRASNPLKLAAGVEESLKDLLLREQSADQMSAVDAVREAFIDIKLHQQCLLQALRAALADYVARLDPEDLENKFTSGKRSGLMSAANKLKYWDLYKDLYQVVTQQIGGQLPQLFVEDLARAYEHESLRSGGSHTRKPQSKLAG